MAYADYEFYTTSYFGSVVPETDFPRLAERASDFIDLMTFDRLVDGLPSNERSQKRIKKAVCSLSELLYQLELAEKNATSYATMNGSSVLTRPGEYGLVADANGNIQLVRGAPAENNKVNVQLVSDASGNIQLMNTKEDSGNKNTGIVTSVSSGSESISYATPQQIGASAKEWSAVYAVAGDAKKTNDLLLKTALPLLMGVRTDEGIPILYAGFQD
nr:MAG TPA: Head Tail Connector Protein [Caudoviricetes sp.]